MKREVESPKAYLAALDGEQLRLVQAIRKVIRAVMPRFVEQLRYGMLDYPGLANLGAQKHYVALYVSPAILEAHREHFPGVDAGKSCLRFRKLAQANAPALENLLADVLAHRESDSPH